MNFVIMGTAYFASLVGNGTTVCICSVVDCPVSGRRANSAQEGVPYEVKWQLFL